MVTSIVAVFFCTVCILEEYILRTIQMAVFMCATYPSLRMPFLYAALAGLTMHFFSIDIIQPALDGLSLVADPIIPIDMPHLHCNKRQSPNWCHLRHDYIPLPFVLILVYNQLSKKVSHKVL